MALLLLSPMLHTHSLVTSIVCYLVPGYLSFLALESKDKDDDIRYLNYWIIFSLAEVFTNHTPDYQDLTEAFNKFDTIGEALGKTIRMLFNYQ